MSPESVAPTLRRRCNPEDRPDRVYSLGGIHSGMARSGIPTRERIISAANALFYNDGIRGVSVECGGGEGRRHQANAVLSFQEQGRSGSGVSGPRSAQSCAVQAMVCGGRRRVAGPGRAIFRNLARSSRHPKWKGCGFLRTSAELANMPGHPAMKIGAAHKKKFEEWLRATFAAAGIAQALQLSREMLLLLDGSFAVVRR